MVTDNTKSNQAAWRLLEDTFPDKFFYGCVAHALNLLVKDIFHPSKTKANNPARNPDKVPMYPEGYPFEDLLHFAEECKNLVNFFKKHHVPKARLESLQIEKGHRFLASPCMTRWGSLLKCIQTIYDSLDVLHTVVTERNFAVAARKDEQMTSIIAFVTDESTNSYCEKSLAILAPIDKYLTLFQSKIIKPDSFRKWYTSF